ncbi:RNA 3'-terminal phosphate cyclase [Archaeoglobus veneficus]|uniref:RNA 3'-terminal phosphate cyclase n=1 Tax=Archaeoglobus veneficus (strain DSM 11195 / SNP6) TaxID=693661 RepID=F2KSM8_ARCVS|nr:RNA 3'-terminal phosphate cyclase [Archaeoglobus veneficus]AEA48098.1 RNA 3'-terminal phosphate cyclase [Archaeoglobus veneficus SNP6]
MIRIDGSYGEGGGQILRTAVALSCLTGEAVEVYNIRANRPKPGLAMQHLKGIEAAKLISDADVEGLKIGSTRVVFRPRKLNGGKFRIDIGTAGSVTLILQTVLLPSLAAEKESFFEIKGGTDVKWSPPVDYVSNVTLKALSALKAGVKIDVLARGYYPKGGGVVRVSVSPSKLEGFEFSEFDCDIIKGISHCSNLPAHVAERQAKAAKEVLESRGYNAEISCEVRRDFSTGSGITLWCGYKGGSALGERGKRAEIVGEEAAQMLLKEMESKACFDVHLADQIMPFAAVARGETRYTTSEISLHQRSNAYVIRQFLGDVVEFDEAKKEVVIRGKGLLS